MEGVCEGKEGREGKAGMEIQSTLRWMQQRNRWREPGGGDMLKGRGVEKTRDRKTNENQTITLREGD